MVLIIEDDKAILGCNIENASNGIANYAEITAIFKAVAKEKKKSEKLLWLIILKNQSQLMLLVVK